MSDTMYKPKVTTSDLDGLELLDKDDLIKIVKKMVSSGVSLMFHGKRTAQEIQRRVRPRSTRVVSALCVGTSEEQAKNFIYEGENLQTMVTLYKYRGQVDLIVTDPPYNTGQHFRYNDRWDEDPNDPDLGTLVTKEDGSRHTKWMKAILPRLQMMKAMLKSNGVLAICIDDNELFHLGMMLDEVFGEENRIAIINWQKTYSPKSDSNHISNATEYVLVYAKDKERAVTGLMPRNEMMDSRYWNPDNDPDGFWKKNGDPTAPTPAEKDRYGIQSPFTGAIHYPGKRAWGHPKRSMKLWLENWGVKYIEKNIGDGRAKALIIQDASYPKINPEQNLDDNPVIEDEDLLSKCSVLKYSKKIATEVLNNKVWPIIHFGPNGLGRPNLKRHLKKVKQGKVPLTFWADDDYDEPIILGCQSWNYEESGHNQAGINELDAIIGKGHGFQTVKPLKLMKKIIHLWCPPNGIVLDPYSGSGTTGHAVLELNAEAKTQRRFILIEQGSPEKGDKYARTLTRERIRRAITGERPMADGSLQVVSEPLGGGFEFRQLLNQIDAKAVLSMKREELIDVVLTSHWDEGRRSDSSLIRLDGYEFLAGKNTQNEGYFIIWNGPDSVGQLDVETYGQLLKEAKKAKLKAPYHVYARYELYQSKSVVFYKIPDKILAHLGLNEFSERYNDMEEGDED